MPPAEGGSQGKHARAHTPSPSSYSRSKIPGGQNLTFLPSQPTPQRHLISILSEKAFLKDVRSGEENVVVVGIASHVVSILAKAATASASAGEGYLGGDVPPLLGGTVLQAIDRLTQREEDAPAVISGLLTSVSDLMGNASNWAQFAECLLFNRRVWEKAPGECKVHLLYVISRYCEMHPRQMLEMGVASVLFSYLSECTFEHRRGILKDGIFNSTFQACSKCIKLLVLSGVEASQEDLRDLVSGCVAFLSCASQDSGPPRGTSAGAIW